MPNTCAHRSLSGYVTCRPSGYTAFLPVPRPRLKTSIHRRQDKANASPGSMVVRVRCMMRRCKRKLPEENYFLNHSIFTLSCVLNVSRRFLNHCHLMSILLPKCECAYITLTPYHLCRCPRLSTMSRRQVISIFTKFANAFGKTIHGCNI